MVQSSRSTWFDRVPKVELHIHLEGAIPHEALWELIRKYGGDPTVPDFQALTERFVYNDFMHFIRTWVWKNRFLREYDDFTFIAEEVARDLASQNIRYAEVIFAPSDFFGHGLETQRLAEAIRGGLSKVPQIEIALVADLVRSNTAENAAMILADVNEVKKYGIAGITIGGSELDNPPEPFADVYEKAREMGFYTSAHAGEAAGAESIWSAIRDLKVDRIGHGTRAFENDNLVDFILDNNIPLEMCPISNVQTRVVDSISRHPVRDYFERGITVTINTDDPKMFGNSLAGEYRVLEEKLGFSRKEIQKLILQGIEASWLSEDKKRVLVKSFHDDKDWQISSN